MTKTPSKKNRKALTMPQKHFLVQALAEFFTPTEAAAAFKEQYGRELVPAHVEHYDPNKFAGRTLSEPLRQLFETHRADYLKNTSKHVPLANKTVRLRELQDTARKMKLAGNLIGYINVLEQIAKEVGGSFTNRREHTGKGGGPIKFQDVEAMSDDELDAELRQLGYHDPDAADSAGHTVQ